MADLDHAMTVEDWPGLAAWLDAHPLPEGNADDDLNMTELAKVFQVSGNTVKSWLAQSEAPMPFVEAGGNGREYVLRLSWCYAWREAQEAQKRGREQKLARLQASLFGVQSSEEEQGLSAKQVRDVAMAKMAHLEASKALGTLTEIEGVYQLLERVFVLFRNSAIGASDRLERELTLTPPQVRIVERAMEEMLTSIGDEISEGLIGKGYTPNFDMRPQMVNAT